jgi:transcriptional regulator with XRE-family HTH domain
MRWRLRRIAARLRQQDLAYQMGITTTRLSQIERGEVDPSDLDRKIIERLLPDLPASGAGSRNSSDRELAEI